ncbi:MAG TPA: S8 family serine peptidase [Candidatus Binatia bacterium]|nr:S8 family serine peptidase [Candidatus Binatia bacterium]
MAAAGKLSPPAMSGKMLVKLRPGLALGAAASGRLEPLYERQAVFGAAAQPAWFLAELKDGAATPWDCAHARVADQLGVDGSDVLFVEPDIVHDIYTDDSEPIPEGFQFGASCDPINADARHGKPPTPPDFAWHLGPDFTQLHDARRKVKFTGPHRTRIAHFDTGYLPQHASTPRHIDLDLQRNYVDGGKNGSSAADPDNRRILFDNSGHGTGTLSILAGKWDDIGAYGRDMGGAPDAMVVPIRIADSVVLLHTSAFAKALQYVTDHGCDVVTMSMGGLPSRLWREAVDDAYMRGVCIVAAAGNNANAIPTRHIVYPARYGRVIAACGVMANHMPYAQLTGIKTLEGNYGPDSCMASAISAYTPNVPWARYECPNLVRLNGEGTSSATPQVAAAAALWLEKHKGANLPRTWQRVEAVRHALFSTARQVAGQSDKLGRGILRAADALAVAPTLGLPQTPSDRDSFAFLRVLTGLGVGEPPPREQMFNVEMTQRWVVNKRLQELVPDPATIFDVDKETTRKIMEAVIEDEGASLALRRHLALRYPAATGGAMPPVLKNAASNDVVPKPTAACDMTPSTPEPPYRRLRVYAVDPSQSVRLDTANSNEVTVHVRWEKDLEPGPIGEYLAVEDIDFATQQAYPPVDLNDEKLLAQDGWAPSEGNAQFHQQMTYAVAMKTVEHFEKALGRPVLWRPENDAFRKRLIIRPHALLQANAYYSPEKIALEFGYFDIPTDAGGDQMPGSRVYTCLSHDIIAHETAHAVLDGMHRRFNEPSNPDVLALHEAFADIVALLQHFTIPEILEREIARIRGDIEAESMLGSLALQLGQASFGRGALRQAVGSRDSGQWTRLPQDPTELQRRLTPHSRGAVLVAAIFDAFIAIYKTRTADLLRIYTHGTGVLPAGAIHPDLVRRLAMEASKLAGHVLSICIRALDYLPPVDVTFFEYLRALITADYDLVADDRYNYRVAFVEAFRRRGIYPVALGRDGGGHRTLSVETLRWKGIDESDIDQNALDVISWHYSTMVESLREFVDKCAYVENRSALHALAVTYREQLTTHLRAAFRLSTEFASAVGIDPDLEFHVEELRRAIRVTPDGRHIPQVVVILTQTREIAATDDTPAFTFRGGATILADLSVPVVKYCIVKKIDTLSRQQRTAEFVRDATSDPLRALVFGCAGNEPFAVLHALADDGL